MHITRIAWSFLILATAAAAQVHYHEDGRPWKQRARQGPDAEVPGWFYNLGITGLRVELVDTAKTHLFVRHVFPGSAAHRKIKAGDVIVGAQGKLFRTPHRNGYGMKVFGAHGPIADFAAALERCQDKKANGKLDLMVRRGEQEEEVTLTIGTKYGSFAPDWPSKCKKSDRILAELTHFLVESQRADGSWGHVVPNTFAPLALLATGDARHREAVTKAARFHARTTKAADQSSLINWRYMAAAIVLAEYHLQTNAEWVLPELEEIRDFILATQYMSLDQVNPRVKETHPRSFPKTAAEQHGGWGHNPGFEGYGPIAMITGQGALALAMIKHCGLAVPRSRLDAAYDFLKRATGKNGYVWYEDAVPGHDRWADPGRTGAAGLAFFMSPYSEARYRRQAALHASCLGAHPESFPDTHGSPLMGMGYAALAARPDPGSWRRLLDSNRWWFTLAHCHDGSFYYQPNRDNAGYGPHARLHASAVVALVLTIPQQSLHLTGKRRSRR